MLARVDARQLRERAGIGAATVARAFDVSRQSVYQWETGKRVPQSAAAIRWARFTAGLERHAQVPRR